MGVYLSSDINWKEHIREVTARANKILGSLKEAFVCRDSGLLKNLYTSLVRPHLEHAVQVWSPTREMDIVKVQARATKIPTSMRNIRYEARLKKYFKSRNRNDFCKQVFTRHIFFLQSTIYDMECFTRNYC